MNNKFLTVAIIINLVIVVTLGLNMIESRVLAIILAVFAGAESIAFCFYAIYKAETELK